MGAGRKAAIDLKRSFGEISERKARRNKERKLAVSRKVERSAKLQQIFGWQNEVVK